jgi:hypothetical protein
MKREDAISFCRYYKGEKECPLFYDPNKSLLWEYEKYWVDQSVKFSNIKEEDYVSDGTLEEYLSVGLTHFQRTDGIPITLKALLFNRYAKTSYSMKSAVDGFKEFYLKYYSDEALR